MAADETYSSARTMVIGLLLLAVAIASLITYLVTRSITKPINEAVSLNQKLAAGDLSVVIEADRGDETGKMLAAMKNMVDRLKDIMGDIGLLTAASLEGKLATRADAAKHQGDFRKIVEGVNNTLDAVIGPLNVSAEYVDRISKGDIPAKITDEYKGDFNEIKNNLNNCIDNIQALVRDTDLLTAASLEGKLATRADAAKHQGDFRKIVEGVNNTLDAVIGPLNVSAEYVDRISKGDIPAKITDEYNGDFNEIKNNLNNCIDNIQALVRDTDLLTAASLEGKLATRADAAKHQGDFRKIVEGVNNTLDAVIGPLNVSAEYVDRISKGDIPAKITDEYKGDFNEIKNNLNNCIDNIQALVRDTDLLTAASLEGKLATRADAAKHQGDFRKIVEGVNNTLDAVIGPLNVSAEYVDRISKGDIPAKITDEYKGDFNEIKNNLNNCIDNILALVNDANLLAMAAVEGKLATRADAAKHQGDFRLIVEGVNNTLDAVINPLNVSAEYIERISKGDIPPRITDEYRGDFNEIKNNLNRCIDTLNSFILEMGNMSKEHDAGDIDVEIPADKFAGAYRTMAQGVNGMVMGHISVKKKAMACIAEFAKGNFEAELEKFPGKKVFINDNIEGLRTNVKSFIQEMLHMSQEHDAGDIDVEIPADKFAGAYRTMAQGVNGMVMGHISVKKKAMACIAEFAKGNFEAELEKFPGKKVFINDNIEGLRTNVKSFIQEMSRMASEHDAGDIDVEIPDGQIRRRLPHHGPGGQRHGHGPHQRQEEGHGLHRRVRQRQLRRRTGEVPGEESLY